MGYLIFQILFFLLIAALLGFVIGWLLRGSRFQSELKDLDARWRSKLGEVEGDRDRFASEVTQANEARTKAEAASAEARRLADTHDASLKQLRREHQTKLDLLADTEQRAGGLEKELADAKAAQAKGGSGGADEDRLGSDLAAATARSEELQRDLRTAKEANAECRNEVSRLQSRIEELQRATGGSGAGGGALGLVGPAGSTAGGETTGPSDSDADDATATSETAGSSRPLGLVGGMDTTEAGAGSGGGQGGEHQPGYRQHAAAPSHLAETGAQGFSGADSTPSSSESDNQVGGSQDSEGVRPEGLSAPHGGLADDLKKISGVGPKLESTLNELGIFHFSQIAEFSPEHVAWVDQYLRFKGRIEREKWIEQAKVLAAGGETEFSRRN